MILVERLFDAEEKLWKEMLIGDLERKTLMEKICWRQKWSVMVSERG